METLEAKVKRIVADNLGVEIDSLTAEADLETVHGMDSLDAMELVAEIEEEFDIEIADKEITDLRTLTEIIRVVKEKKRG